VNTITGVYKLKHLKLVFAVFYDHFQHMILINVSGNVFLHTIPK